MSADQPASNRTATAARGAATALVILCPTLAATLFVLDLVIPLGVAFGVTYSLVVLIALAAPGHRLALAMAGLCSILVLAGFALSDEGSKFGFVAANRALSLFTVWVAAVLGIRLKSLSRRAEDLAAIVASSKDAIVGFDLDGRVRSWNDGAARMFGKQADEAIGGPVPVMAEEGGSLEGLLSVVRGGQSVQRVESFRRNGEGAELHLSLTISPVQDDLGNVLSGAVIARDISALRKAELEIRRLNENLEERIQQRTAQLRLANEELESFSYSVSHDLRTPLRVTDGFCQALVENCSDRLDEKGLHYLNRLQAASDRMAKLIEDLLDLSRVSRSDMAVQPVDLSLLATEAVEELRKAEPDRSVEVRVQPGLEDRGDPRLLRVVLDNLLGNAWKFTSRTAEARIDFGVEEGDVREYFVRDNGAGFDPEFASRLFGAFQRLHKESEFPGTGIGLATVRRIVRRHGGEVRAEGAPEQGATIRFTLASAGGEERGATRGESAHG